MSDENLGISFVGPSFGLPSAGDAPAESSSTVPPAEQGQVQPAATAIDSAPAPPIPPARRARLDGPLELRLRNTLEHWRHQLLDLTKRNRALNFRAQRTATVTVVDEQPPEVFKQLVLQAGSMRFAPAKLGAGTRVTSRGGTEAEGTDGDTSALQLDFAPYDSEDLDDRHTDDVLQCDSSAEKLDQSLRRLAELARSTQEEQGINALYLTLGMLHYRESRDSEETFRAPLVLVPVELTRRSARAGYEIRATDDESIVNPSLVEYLRRTYGLVVPELPPDYGDGRTYDLQELLTRTQASIAQQPAWRLTTEIFLTQLNFQKLVMYKDLELNADAITGHRLVQQLVTREAATVAGLPDDVREMALDATFPPEARHGVVDADSSQLRAIAAVAAGHDLVLEGPPGTGKSQTITNLIAESLAAGKSVLFVAEKMAALEVVHTRLVAAGLGEFCLEMHSTKANKRSVMQSIGAAIDASLQVPVAPSVSGMRLRGVRGGLTDYVNALHEPWGSAGYTPFSAYGELGRVLNAAKVTFGADPAAISLEQLEQMARLLTDYARLAAATLPVAGNAWRGSRITYYSESRLDDIANVVTEASSLLAALAEEAREVEKAFGVPHIDNFGATRTALAIAEAYERSPGAPLAVLESAAWNAAPPEALERIQQLRATQGLKRRVAAWFLDAVLEDEHQDDIVYVRGKAEGFFSFMALLDGRYRSIRRQWLALRRPSYRKSLIDQAADLRVAGQLRAALGKLNAERSQAQQLFGALWNGVQSDVDVLERYVAWVVEFRQLCVANGLERAALERAAVRSCDIAAVRAMVRTASQFQETVGRLERAGGWPANAMTSASFDTLGQRLGEIAGSRNSASVWAAAEGIRQQLEVTAAASLAEAGASGVIPLESLPAVFHRSFLQASLDAVFKERPELREFHGTTHEQRVVEFRELDRRVLVENRVSLVSRLRAQVQQRLREPSAAAGMPFLRREMAKQRALSPLRRTMQQAQVAVRTIKPCFLMSPLSVAQYLNFDPGLFDVVIFDEASQLPSEEAIGAITRGKQLVVVGDPKQLPPTDFFTVSLGGSAPIGEDGQPLYEDSESVLEEYMGAGVPMARLKWHYRSAHESLIRFSNVQFYDSDLYTFPSVEMGGDDLGLSFEYVADGVYEGKGLNLVEARRVADAVVEHIKLRPHESLGVGTFNVRQQLAIQDELELRRRQDPSIEFFFSSTQVDPFFVKNLENIQGDERDAIFLSVTYGKASDGRLRMAFGPLNLQNGWRRLNVLITRARRRMRVFSSMRGDEINPVDSSSDGPRLLREFLLFAEKGVLDSPAAKSKASTESPFEREVLEELTRRGCIIDPQVGTAGYRVDLGVRDNELPGRYVCGIECDGYAYHSSETARDRDRLRQQVLEARGWRIIRLWSTDWFKDRAHQIERLVGEIDQARQLSRDELTRGAERRQNQESGRAAAEAERLALAIAPPAAITEYERPTVAAYRMASGQGKYAATDILEVPLARIAKAVTDVVAVESPVHVEDVGLRVASLWDTRRGSRVAPRIDQATRAVVRDGSLEQRGDYLWVPGTRAVPRSRAGTRVPAERVAPEEYEATILAVLSAAKTLTRDELASEVRAVLGYGRSSTSLTGACAQQVAVLLERGVIGEGSLGLAIRR